MKSEILMQNSREAIIKTPTFRNLRTLGVYVVSLRRIIIALQGLQNSGAKSTEHKAVKI